MEGRDRKLFEGKSQRRVGKMTKDLGKLIKKKLINR